MCKNRCTGKTYRRCLEACLAASNGKKVLFLTTGSYEQKLIRLRLSNMAADYTVCGSVSSNVFTFASGGCIEVANLTSCLSGKQFNVAVTDELEYFPPDTISHDGLKRVNDSRSTSKKGADIYV